MRTAPPPSTAPHSLPPCSRTWMPDAPDYPAAHRLLEGKTVLVTAAAGAGVIALTRSAAMEAAPHGVRVNAVSPSLAIHPYLSKVIAEEQLEELIELEAFKRSAETWEVANVIVFLASDYASYMTGE